MGLLWDTPEERARKEAQQRIASLLGTEARPAQYGQFGAPPGMAQPSPEQAFNQRFTTQLTPAQEGTGYLGSDRGVAAQTSLLNEAMGAGASESQAMGLLQPTQNVQAEQQAQNRFLLGKQIDAEMQERYRIDGFANKKEKLAAETAQGDKYNKLLAPSRESINYYNKGADLYKNAKFTGDKLSGTDSLSLARYYLKQTLPNESVMSDDIGNLTFSQGVPEYISSWLSRLFGDGSMSKGSAQEILQTMYTSAEFESSNRDDIRQQYSDIASEYSLSTNFLGKKKALAELPFKSQGKMNRAPTQAEALEELKRRQSRGRP